MMAGGFEFEVLGRRLVVERRGDAWVARERGSDGTSRPVDFRIPAELNADAIADYLADLFHESLRPGRPGIRRIE